MGLPHAFIQGTDYPKLGSAYLSCTCALENGAAHARTVNPTHIEYTTIRARTDNKLLNVTPCWLDLTFCEYHCRTNVLNVNGHVLLSTSNKISAQLATLVCTSPDQEAGEKI